MIGFNLPSLSDTVGKPKLEPPQPNIGFNDSLDLNKDGQYVTPPENWYTAKPYGFKWTSRSNKSFTMFLPIAPSNLNIATGFATNLIPTLYGTVEEHSPVRYYDITIEGTTGMAPKYVEPDQKNAYLGRSGAPIAHSLSGSLGGFFSKTLSLIDQVRNTASSFGDKSKDAKTAVKVDQTGYVAFHNLYKFLLKYKEDTSGDENSTQPRPKHPLTFFNYKDNNQYDVAVRSFTLRRSADNPMLYYYSITLRGYNLRSMTDEAQDTTADRLKSLGLDGVDGSSFLGKAKGIANKVKGILGPLGAGINILGR